MGSPALTKAGVLSKPKQSIKVDDERTESNVPPKHVETVKLQESKPDFMSPKAPVSNLSVPENGSSKDSSKKGSLLNKPIGKPPMDISPLTGRRIDRNVGVDQVKQQFEGNTEHSGEPLKQPNPPSIPKLPPRPQDKQKESKGGVAEDLGMSLKLAPPIGKKEDDQQSSVKKLRAYSLQDGKMASVQEGEEVGIKRQGVGKSPFPAGNDNKKGTRSDSIREEDNTNKPSSPTRLRSIDCPSPPLSPKTTGKALGATSGPAEANKSYPKVFPPRDILTENDTSPVSDPKAKGTPGKVEPFNSTSSQSPKFTRKFNQQLETGAVEGGNGTTQSSKQLTKPVPLKPDAGVSGDGTSDKLLISKGPGKLRSQSQPVPFNDEPKLPPRPGKNEPPLPSKVGKDEPPLPSKPPKDEPPLPSKPPKDEPPLPSKPPKYEPPLPSKPSKDEPPLPSKPSKDEPPLPSKPPKDEPPLPSKPSKDEPPLPSKPPKDEPPLPSKPSKDEPPLPSKPPKDEPPLPPRPYKDEMQLPPKPAKNEPQLPAKLGKNEAPLPAKAKNEPPLPAKPAKDEHPPSQIEGSKESPQRGSRFSFKQSSKDEPSKESPKTSRSIKRENSKSEASSAESSPLGKRGTFLSKLPSKENEEQLLPPIPIEEEPPSPARYTKPGFWLPPKQPSKDEMPISSKERSPIAPPVKEETSFAVRPTKGGQALTNRQTSKDEPTLPPPPPIKPEPSPSHAAAPTKTGQILSKQPSLHSPKLPGKDEPALPARPGKGVPLPPTGAKEDSSSKKNR